MYVVLEVNISYRLFLLVQCNLDLVTLLHYGWFGVFLFKINMQVKTV